MLSQNLWDPNPVPPSQLTLPIQEFSGASTRWTLERMDLSCISGWQAPSFYVGTAFASNLTTGITCMPLAEYEYDVIVTTSNVIGTGTVRPWSSAFKTCGWIVGKKMCHMISLSTK